MIDPLSITLSIIALGKAASEAKNKIEALLKLRNNIRASILALQDELESTSALVRTLESIFIDFQQDNETQPYVDRKRLCSERPDAMGILKSNIDVAKATILALDMELTYELQNPDGKPDYSINLGREQRIALLQKNIRRAWKKVVSSLEILGFSETRKLAQLQVRSLRNIDLKMDDVLLQTKDVKDNLDSQKSLLEQLLTATKPTTKLEYADNKKQKYSHQRTAPTKVDSSIRGMMALGLAQRAECEIWCDCRCHQPGEFRSLPFLKPLVGQLFAGYFGSPVFAAECTNTKCKNIQGSAVHVTYLFPSWWVSMVFQATYLYKPQDIKLSWRTHNARKDTDEPFLLAQNGNVDGLKGLLADKKASIHDVTSNNGHSLMHTALRYLRLEVVELLCSKGAESFLENNHGETPFDQAWNYILNHRNTERATEFHVDKLIELFPDNGGLEEARGLPKLHKIVLGLIYRDIEEELNNSQEAVNATDAEGKTALIWAAARGDTTKAKVLLEYGANPNMKDHLGQGPLRASLKAKTPDCMKLLLQNKAKVNQTDNFGQTCLLATQYYPQPQLFIPCLLDYGADCNSQDFRGDTALIKTVKGVNGGNNKSASLILGVGNADIDLQNKAGQTVLHAAIQTNAHEVLKVVLRKWKPDIMLLTQERETILHIAAVHADEETLYILRNAPRHLGLQKLDPLQERRDGQTPIELAQSRLRTNEANDLLTEIIDETEDLGAITTWGRAWGDLLLSLKGPRTAQNSWHFLVQKREDTLSSMTSTTYETWYSFESWHSALADSAPL